MFKPFGCSEVDIKAMILVLLWNNKHSLSAEKIKYFLPFPNKEIVTNWAALAYGIYR